MSCLRVCNYTSMKRSRIILLLKKNCFVSLRSESFSNNRLHDKPTAQNNKNAFDFTFSDYKTALKDLSLFEVFRGYVVYLITSRPFLVNNSLKLMELFRKVFGQFIYKSIMKMTFYGQFVAGEDLMNIRPLLNKLNNNGIKVMLDYCVEEDIPKEDAIPVSDLEIKKSVDKEYDVSGRFVMKQTRTAFYQNEANCERNVDILQQATHALSLLKRDRCILAVKMTALGRPEMLLHLSEVIMQARKFTTQLLGIKGHKNIIEYKLTEEILLKKLDELGVQDTEMFMNNVVRDDSGIIHLFPWYGIVDGSISFSETFRVPSLKEKRMVRLLKQFSSNEEEMFRNMIHRLNTVISTAKANNVIAVIDAEQSYLQPAITRITMELMKTYNKESVAIMNTYQCYLKSTFDEIYCDLQLARRQGFAFATKLVRGAYMAQERQRAKDLNYKDPINPTFEATTEMFNRVAMECLGIAKEYIDNKKEDNFFVIFASHNENSVTTVLNEMARLNILPSNKTIGFGQLLGMKDYITYPLAQNGYNVYKYVPYGPVVKVMPYLARRVDENKGEIFQSSKDCELYRKEFKRRVLRRQK